MIVKVKFLNSPENKISHYFWPENLSLCVEGTELLINSLHSSNKVIIVAYDPEEIKYPEDTKFLDIIKIFKSPGFKKEYKAVKEKQMKSKFEPLTKVVKETVSTNKDTIITMQKGKAVIAALRTTLLEIPGVPDKVKEVIKIPGYSDIALGMLLEICADTFTSNSVITDAASSANFVGAVEFSNQFTILEKVIEETITKAFGNIEKKVESDE